MLDYRIRGYIEYRSTLGGSACANTSITACARQGRLLLRASSSALKVEGPPTGFAVLGNTIIDCPTGIATIVTDASGNNAEADGTFPADRTNPTLLPPLPFVVTAGGDSNGIQIRTLGSSGQCIYGFQVGARGLCGRRVLPGVPRHLVRMSFIPLSPRIAAHAPPLLCSSCKQPATS